MSADGKEGYKRVNSIVRGLARTKRGVLVETFCERLDHYIDEGLDLEHAGKAATVATADHLWPLVQYVAHMKYQHYNSASFHADMRCWWTLRGRNLAQAHLESVARSRDALSEMPPKESLSAPSVQAAEA